MSKMIRMDRKRFSKIYFQKLAFENVQRVSSVRACHEESTMIFSKFRSN